MSEQEDQKTTPAEASEPFKARDEKGLTLSGRLMLRMLLEHIRIQTSATRMGGDSSLYNTLTQETLIDAVEDVIFFSRQIAEKIGGSAAEVGAYLAKHQDADEKMMDDLREEWKAKRGGTHPVMAFLNNLHAQRGDDSSGACDTCGRPLCADCGACHHQHKKPEQIN